MALIKCNECGKEISDQAITCPNCGAKTEAVKHKKNKVIFILIIIFILFLIGIGIFFIKSNNPLHKYSQETISILEKYRNDELTSEEAERKITDIYNHVDIDYNLNDKLDYLSLRTKLFSIKCEFRGGIEEIDFIQIDKYIKELQAY